MKHTEGSYDRPASCLNSGQGVAKRFADVLTVFTGPVPYSRRIPTQGQYPNFILCVKNEGERARSWRRTWWLVVADSELVTAALVGVASNGLGLLPHHLGEVAPLTETGVANNVGRALDAVEVGIQPNLIVVHGVGQNRGDVVSEADVLAISTTADVTIKQLLETKVYFFFALYILNRRSSGVWSTHVLCSSLQDLDSSAALAARLSDHSRGGAEWLARWMLW